MNYLQFVEKENAKVEVGWILEVPNDLSRDEVLKAIGLISRPKGEWDVNSDDDYIWCECSLCEYRVDYPIPIDKNYGYKYCPNCGAEMQNN